MRCSKQNTTRRCGASLTAVSLFLFSSAGAQAVVLNPGDLAPLSGTTFAARPELGGVVLVDTLRPFSIDLGGGLSITGEVQDRVVRSDDDDTLDFYYRIINDEESDGSIVLTGRSDFGAVTTDVDWRIDGLGVDGPGFGFRHPDGTEITFGFFDGTIDPGEDSRFFFVKTDATEYQETGSAFLTGQPAGGGMGTSTTFLTYEPAAPVPLPAAAWLLGSGLIGLIGVTRRKIAA